MPQNYDFINGTYSMKCRLYPSKSAAKAIDDAIYAVQCYHNALLYNIYNNLDCTTAKAYKRKKELKKVERQPGESKLEYEKRLERYELENKYKDGDTIHFVDFKRAFSSANKSMIMSEHPCINNAPAAAITTQVGLLSDMKKSFGKVPIEFQKPSYYSSRKKRNSITYQILYSSIFTKPDADNIINKNVFYVNLGKRIGTVKVRGWNRKIRFDEKGEKDFIDYALLNSNKKVTITVSKDNCGDFWIIFTLSNAVYKPISRSKQLLEIGIDVGIEKIITTSEDVEYENERFKQQEEEHLEALNRRLSRRYGWENIDFRNEHKRNKDIHVSKRYIETSLKKAKLERKIARKRKLYYNEITMDIIKNSSFIAIESLSVSGMLKNKNHSYSLSDAALSSLLQMIRYKGEWHKVIVQPIDRWFPSSKRCNNCGYVLPELSLSTREWTCPKCHVHHKRDTNAAKNIRDEGLIIYKALKLQENK